MMIQQIVTGRLDCNNYLLINKERGEGLLIDCGDDAKKLMGAIDAAKIKLKGILLTHGHADHIAAVDQLASYFGCPVYIHRDDMILLKKALYNLSLQVLGKGMKIQTEVLPLGHDDQLDLAGFCVQLIHTPGHTPGSACFLTENVLFTGDTLFEGSIGGDFPPFGNLEQEISSIRERLFGLKQNYPCYPGHGNKTSLDFEKQNNMYCRI